MSNCTTYNAAISGMTNEGTVTVSIAQARATSAAGDTNAVSTSSDDTVTFSSASPDVGSQDNNEDNSSVNSSSQTNTQSKPPGCTDPVSPEAPNIFEIQTTATSATLYFVPPSMPYSSFYIAYSQSASNWNYGVEFKQGQSSGAVKYTINELSSNTRYYFQVRSGNGCATGSWGNILTGTTKFLRGPQTSKALIAPTISKPVPVTAQQSQAPLIDKPVNNDKIQDQEASTNKSPRYCLLWWCF